MPIRFNFNNEPDEKVKPNLLYFIKDTCTCAYNQYAIFTHTISEVFYIIDGEGNARVEENTYPFSKGDFYIINPYVSHSEFLKKDLNQSFHYYILGVENLFIPPDKNPYKPIRLSPSDKIVQILNSMYDELTKEKDDSKQIASIYFDLLCAYIYRKYNTSYTECPAIYSQDIVGKVQSYIDVNFGANISSKTISDYFNCNQNTLSRKFKSQLNMSIQQYILLKRIDLSKTILQTDNLSITELTFKCGFNDSAYFCKYFKKIVGMSPSTYRNLIRGKTKNKEKKEKSD